MKKTLSIWSFFTVGFGATTGARWVLLVDDWTIIGGDSIAAIIASLVGAIFLFPIKAVLGELTAVIPISGGIIEYVGRTHGNNMFYITDWFLALGNGILCPWRTIAIPTLVSDMSGGLFPASRAVKPYIIMGVDVCLSPTVTALGSAFYVISLDFRGASVATKLQALPTKMLLVDMLLTMSISFIKGGPSNILPVFSKAIDPSFTTSASNMPIGIISVLVMTLFFYVGLDTIPQQAEEAVEGLDRSKFGKVTSMASLAVGGLYMIYIYSFGTIIPQAEFAQGTVPALMHLKNTNMALYVAMLIIATLGSMGSMSSFRGATSRIILTMGRREQPPSSFVEIDGKSGAPKMVNMVLMMLTVVKPFPGKNILVSLTNVPVLTFVFSCTMVSFACLKMREAGPDLPRPYKVSDGKSGIGMVCLAGSIIIALVVVPFSPAALKPVEQAIMTGWLATGLILKTASSKKSVQSIFLNFIKEGSHMNKVTFCGGFLVDGTGAEPVKNSLVLIEDDKTVYAGIDKEATDYEVKNIADRTIMPGLIDSHLHFSDNLADDDSDWMLEGVVQKLVVIVQQAHERLKNGLVTVGEIGHNGIAIRNMVETGVMRKSHTAVIGLGFCRTAGHGDSRRLLREYDDLAHPQAEHVDSPWDSRKAVRRRLCDNPGAIRIQLAGSGIRRWGQKPD